MPSAAVLMAVEEIMEVVGVPVRVLQWEVNLVAVASLGHKAVDHTNRRVRFGLLRVVRPLKAVATRRLGPSR